MVVVVTLATTVEPAAAVEAAEETGVEAMPGPDMEEPAAVLDPAAVDDVVQSVVVPASTVTAAIE